MCYLYQCNPLRNFKSGFIKWRKCAWNNFFWINGAKIWYRISRFINAHANITSCYAIFHYCWYLLKQPVVPSRHFLLPRFSSTRFAATSSLLSSKSSLIKINHIYTNIRLKSIQITHIQLMEYWYVILFLAVGQKIITQKIELGLLNNITLT